MLLSKPVIAAVSGYAVAGGLELACWCDLRVVERDAVFGVFCRRFGVPLTDGGTQRLPRLIGMSRALDMILTGRPVSAQEAYAMGLAQGQYRGTATVGHAGSDAAFVADMTYCPQYDLGVAVLCNTADIDPNRVRNAVLDCVIFGETTVKEGGSEARSPQPPAAGESNALRERLLGNYGVNGSGDVICLSRDGEELWGSYLGQGNVRLDPRNESTAASAEGDIVVRVLAEEAGVAEKIELNLKGTLLTASRIPESKKDLAGLAGVTGLYYSPVLGAVYSITMEDGRLEVAQRRSVGTHDLAFAGKATLVCSLGELRLARDAAGRVSGFTLWHETVGGILFSKIGTDPIPAGS